jgi:hypothetical protein
MGQRGGFHGMRGVGLMGERGRFYGMRRFGFGRGNLRGRGDFFGRRDFRHFGNNLFGYPRFNLRNILSVADNERSLDDLIPLLNQSFSNSEVSSTIPPSFSLSSLEFSNFFAELSNDNNFHVKNRSKSALLSLYFYALSLCPFAAFFTQTPSMFPFVMSASFKGFSEKQKITLVRLINHAEELFENAGLKKKGVFFFFFKYYIL